MKEIGKLIIITGPSGVGKGTVVKQLIAKNDNFFVSTSATTRQPREGEKNGREYYFLGETEFKSMIKAGNFLEWAEYAGNFYGTPKQPVLEQIEQGKKVILEIELVGARQVKNNFSEALSIFILPPSLPELERRLRGRGNDSEEAIIRRLAKAKGEIDAVNEFDFRVINDQLEVTVTKLEQIVNN